MDSKLMELAAFGQSVWLDYIDRELLETGGLSRLVDLGVTGVTTNPTIFQQAISKGDRYDQSIRTWLEAHPRPEGDREPWLERLLEHLMVEDVRAAADALRPVHERTGGEDGYVSLEVSPLLAYDTEATKRKVQALAGAVGRPNVMIKIPATEPGLPAIESMLAAGFNINITLLFGLERYGQVQDAHQSALEQRETPGDIASVASFFISRIDSKIDPQLEAHGSQEALALRGKIALASARLAHRQLRRHINGPAFGEVAVRGGRVQRLLWGSTGTKNPDYSDVLYVQNLCGPNTVNTMPPATLDAFRDHGVATDALLHDLEQAEHDLAALDHFGISLEAVTAELESEGVEKFADSWRAALEALEAKCAELAPERVEHEPGE